PCAASSITATAVFRGRAVILSFGLPGMPQPHSAAIKRFRLFRRNRSERIYERENALVGLLLVELIGLIANCVTPAAFHPMPVVIEHLFERPKVNHRLIALEARSLLAFECLHRDRAEFDPFHGAPRFFITL